MVPVPFVVGMLGEIFLIGKSFIVWITRECQIHITRTQNWISISQWCEVLMQQHQNGEYNIIMGTTLCFNNWFHLSGQHTHTHTHTHKERKRKLKLKCVLGLYMVLVHVFSLILDSNMEVLIIWFHPTGKIRLVKNAEGLSSISLDNLCKYFCFT